MNTTTVEYWEMMKRDSVDRFVEGELGEHLFKERVRFADLMINAINPRQRANEKRSCRDGLIKDECVKCSRCKDDAIHLDVKGKGEHLFIGIANDTILYLVERIKAHSDRRMH